MELALIAPTNALEDWGSITTYHMALAHLILSDEDYAKHYFELSQQGHFVILDNSVIELGGAVEVSTLLEAAALVNPAVIVLPDVLDDMQATHQAIHKAISDLLRANALNRFRFMAVPQGKTKEEFFMSYKHIAALSDIYMIGMPKRLGRYDESRGIGRANVIEEMLRLGLIDTSKPHHLLGVWDNPVEIKHLSKHNWIKGVDTQLPFWAAANGVKFDKEVGMIEKRKGRNITLDMAHIMDEDDLNNNIMCMLRWANWKNPKTNSSI